jgi:hypothetical protein
MPWTTPDDVADIFAFIDEHHLADATDPVQMSIKLLMPRGSLLVERPELTPHLTGYEGEALTWRWEFANPETEILHKHLEAIAASGSDRGQETVVTLDEMRAAVAHATGRTMPPLEIGSAAPRLTESWFCCAEPGGAQALTISRR